VVELYCEVCGCRISAAWDVGCIRWRRETWGAGGQRVVRRMVVICASCREEEIQPPLSDWEAAIEAAFDRWIEQERRGNHGFDGRPAAHVEAHVGDQHAR